MTHSKEMTYTVEWLKNKFDNNESIKYIFFWGHTNNSFEVVGKFLFSQWYPSPFTVDGIIYKSAEHWMMAHKAILFNDHDVAQQILKAEKPGQVKALGRQIKAFDERVWDEYKFDIVKQGSIHKFTQDKKFGDYLLATNDRILAEASPVDNVWGIGLSQDAKNIENPYYWKGLNLLGFALMEARDFLKGTHL
jgi:ribA/ribD-fused uncharacterized protein